MNIDNSKINVTIPKYEYDRMLDVINNKKDIRVEFRLIVNDRYSLETRYLLKIEYEMSDDEKRKNCVSEMSHALNKELENYNLNVCSIVRVHNEYVSTLEKKWWFRLFSKKIK